MWTLEETTHKTQWVPVGAFPPHPLPLPEALECGAEEPETQATPPQLWDPQQSYLALLSLSFLILLSVCSNQRGRSVSRGFREECGRRQRQVPGTHSLLSHLLSQPLMGTLQGLQKQPISGTFCHLGLGQDIASLLL